MDAMRYGRGFTLVEAMVGLLVGSLVLAGGYSIWKTHEVEGFRLGKKIDLRNEMALSSKRIERAVTLAGLGLNRTASLAKDDAVGSDTLTVFINASEAHCALAADASHYQASARVGTPSLFAGAGYLALSDSAGGEVRKILRIEGSSLVLDAPFARDYARASSTAFPANRQRFYTDQAASHLVWESDGHPDTVARELRNFQVSFCDRLGKPTQNPAEVRAVNFSFAGIFPARAGALNSMIFSSTAIPRNVQ